MNTIPFLTAARLGILTCLLAGSFALLQCPGTFAQRAAGDVGIGFQAGQPTGLSIKIYKPGGLSPDFLAAWDLDDFFFLSIIGIKENGLDNQHQFHFFYGPGAFIGIRDWPREYEDEVVIGFTGAIGLNVLIEKLEIFIQATPRLALIERTDFDMGGGAGMRYYF